MNTQYGLYNTQPVGANAATNPLAPKGDAPKQNYHTLTTEEREKLEAEATVSYLVDIYWYILIVCIPVYYIVVTFYTFLFFYRGKSLVFLTLLSIAALAALVRAQHSRSAAQLLPALFHIPRSQFPTWLQRPGPALGLISALGCGAVTGLIIYALFGRTAVVYENSRMYYDAVADVPAGAYADAGRVIFTSTVDIDPHKSAGFYADDGHIYCVAAIKDSQQSRVEVWAVGLDCCGAESSFACGPVNDIRAKAGLRVLDSRGVFPQLGERGYFDQARLKAEAALGIPQAGDVEPLYLRWQFTEDVKSSPGSYRSYAFTLIAIATLLYSVALGYGLWLAMQPPKKPVKTEDMRLPKYGPDGLPRGKFGPDGMPFKYSDKVKKFGADGMPKP
eukprot:TRINITY_DN84097_c0_g1_i1.p1 TRINITY_DN84097_c0_g1~~TRINITY_DN84097_c0_g1_i1.p1  ORF type:complete len:389 (-),score=42.83 TRINITY_DN84097_c0_g1_i1:153-1319(-)